VGFLVQVVDVADELDGVDDLLVVEEHTSDLAGIVAVVLLDDGVDGVSDLLSADLGLGLESSEFGGVHEGLWLGTHELGGGAHAWVGVLLAVGLHAAWSSVVWSWATVITTSVVLSAASSIAVLIATTVLVAAITVLVASTVVLVAAVTVLVSTTALMTAITVLIAAASLVVVLSGTAITSTVVVAALTAVVVLLLSHVATLHLTSWASLLGALHVEVLHEVLLNLLEASLLTLSVKFGAWDPELDAQGSCTEWGGLVELLDGGLCALDVLVEDEVLSVGSGWVEVLALSQLD